MSPPRPPQRCRSCGGWRKPHTGGRAVTWGQSSSRLPPPRGRGGCSPVAMASLGTYQLYGEPSLLKPPLGLLMGRNHFPGEGEGRGRGGWCPARKSPQGSRRPAPVPGVNEGHLFSAIPTHTACAPAFSQGAASELWTGRPPRARQEGLEHLRPGQARPCRLQTRAFASRRRVSAPRSFGPTHAHGTSSAGPREGPWEQLSWGSKAVTCPRVLGTRDFRRVPSCLLSKKEDPGHGCGSTWERE